MGAGVRRRRRQLIQDLVTKIHTLEEQNKKDTSQKLSAQLSRLRYDLRMVLLDNFDLAARRLKMTYYVSGNKAGKLLANRLRGIRYKTKIPYILHPTTKEKLYHPQAIADAFSCYYNSLYNLKEDQATIQPTESMISTFLDQVSLPRVARPGCAD